MSQHNKRYNIPSEKWGIPTKESYWAPSSTPGPHSADRSIPLVVILRDILKYTETSKEAEHILAERKVEVDGKITTDKNRPIGLMDVISIPDISENYRVLFDQKGKFRLLPIDKDQAEWKLVKIKDKTTLKDGITQYNLHDGTNIRSENGSKYNTKDVLKVQLPSRKILDAFQFGEGQMALVTGGNHIGELGTIEEYEVIRGSQPNFVHFESEITTVEKYVFIIGKDKPIIEIPEVGII
ncbi:MAG: 30S ribosomal protein S4e [Candidatus Thermoplasmatota archaeon]|nr:30S ribosomal protein S4e [Candidatus Thermoplasmatota archaeon]